MFTLYARISHTAHTLHIPTTCTTLQHCVILDYDLILLDLGLPKRDGFEVMRAVRACGQLQQSRVPIIIISARAIDDAAAQVCTRHCLYIITITIRSYL
jgi:DNA-binding response OmpR family regulator